MKAGRKRNVLGAEVEARIALGVKRGETAEQVAKAIGGATSRATISRRMRELRGPIQAPRSPKLGRDKPKPKSKSKAEPSIPTSPDDIPADADLPALHSLLERCKAALAKAEQGENLTLVGQMIRVAASLSETIRKATPPKQSDPNEAPDMVALRIEAARKWHQMVDLVADDASP